MKSKDKVFIIAEIGNNHEGNYSHAEQMIHLAAEAEVDAVKFQTFNTELFVSQKDKQRFEILKSFQLSYDEFENLSKVAKSLNLSFISTPLDLDSAFFLKDIVDIIKISSGDNNFFPLIETVSAFDKPIILSTGLLDINEVRISKSLIEEIWKNKKINQNLYLLHCVSAYPVEPHYANLMAIKTMISSFDNTIGYSDHTLGNNASITAVALGARIIEKHFTLDKNYSNFRDHQLSADPSEMKDLVESIRNVEELFGSGQKEKQPPEEEVLPLVRRSIVAKRDISGGDIIDMDDLTWVRPSGGLSPGSENKIVGKKAKNDISKGEMISLDEVV